MNEQTAKTVSKFLSLVLRHSPEKIGLKLDENGWADVEELILKCSQKGNRLDKVLLDYVVENNDKKRFAYNEDETKIRASQGHSISVELNLAETEPSEYLYHGTVGKFMENIQKEGLKKMSRQYVHLSKDKETAIKVGSRRGVPQILTVRSGEMHRDGFKFYLSENNVWLTDEVPAKYIEFKS
ncbi:putative RNA 2'-phosphotransferase [Flavobacterium sp. CF108]|jgi:putative RNA 2'-phosphotransferase|uniref:RNA 2'-phosphotransferase n=1 Tax=unclassified Flavobacterium TaxID=196869 RepID=UPI0008B05263|nr:MULTISPECIES: RNA 2'-phosphotransferase [unclassified Flavobacterium]SEP13060.1 putative RNA 2'-phosphotransferase [Flavobacterium sp. fv08]SHH51371.1 putative RNA 2'-phosphotransferase [Flavobacterium sp. CF108]